MNLGDLFERSANPIPWSEGENIPWNEPGFSRRMLKEHLSQVHDAASRRFEIIDLQVAWIHSHLLDGQPSHILDLACGPGLYTERLARRGHICHGIDYSPASIEYAIATARGEDLACSYDHQDIRRAEYPQEMDLVMLIYGELNVFRSGDAKSILSKAWQALKPGGWLLLEPHPYHIVKRLGKQPAIWYASRSGLFSERPHLLLQENFWDESSHTTTMRYYRIDAQTGKVKRYAQSMQAYRDKEYLGLLRSCGFKDVQISAGLGVENLDKKLFAITGRK